MKQSTAENLEETLYTTSEPNADVHTCVVVFDRKHAVSILDGRHSSFQIGEKVMLYNLLNPAVKVETVVSAISNSYDLIVFKLLSGEFKTYVPELETLFRGQRYVQLGISPSRNPLWNGGIVSEKRDGFYVGPSHRKLKESASGIFTDNGCLIGMATGTKPFAFSDPENAFIIELAEHQPVTHIISTDSILIMTGIVGSNFEALDINKAGVM